MAENYTQREYKAAAVLKGITFKRIAGDLNICLRFLDYLMAKNCRSPKAEELKSYLQPELGAVKGIREIIPEVCNVE